MNPTRSQVIVLRSRQESLTVTLIHDKHDFGSDLCSQEGRFLHSTHTRILPLGKVIWCLDSLYRCRRLAEPPVMILHSQVLTRLALSRNLQVLVRLHHILRRSDKKRIDATSWMMQLLSTLSGNGSICAWCGYRSSKIRGQFRGEDSGGRRRQDIFRVESGYEARCEA